MQSLSGNVQGGEKSLAECTWEQPALWDASRFRIPKEAAWQLRRDKLLSGLACGDESAVVFHAGAGYGKTTVMAEWASEHRAQSCWYRLHESDNQFGCFLRGIAAALSDLVDAAVFRADFFEADMRLAAEKVVEGTGEMFLAKCLPALPAGQIFICLDDFHFIHNETVLNFLLRFMEYAEGKARFFFASKSGFPAFLAANLMRGAASEVLENELRFEEGETAHLLRSMSGRALPERVVKEIHADTNGWPAGVMFAGIDLKSAQPLSTGRFLFDRTHLYQYIFQEVFRKLAYDTQRFLTESSVLEKMMPPLCDYALGRSDSAGMLHYLLKEHLFLSRAEGEEDAYFYEGVSGGFLRSRLSDGRRVEVLLKAAQYHVRRGEWEEAARDAMACGEKGCGIVAAVFEKRAGEMRSSGKQVRLREWMDYLAEFREQMTDTALFCMYECLCMDGETERGAEFLRKAAEKAYAKLRYDLYERYMRELAAFVRAFPQGGQGMGQDSAVPLNYAEDGRTAAQIIEKEAREKLAVRGIVPRSWDMPESGRTLAWRGGQEDQRNREGQGNRWTLKKREDQKNWENQENQEVSLYVQCMGALSVRGPAGEVVWRTKKTKELFACLFYENGRWAARDALTERLWQEKPADKSLVLFHTTMSYLRKVLAAAGALDCLLVKNQSYALDMTKLDSDIAQLRSGYDCLKKGETLTEERALRFTELYGEGYLYGEDYVWADVYREQVEQRYLWMLQTLAKQNAADGRYREAAMYLKKAVEVDNYALDAMEGVVECLLRCRDIAGARRAYERLTEASMELLNEKPERAFEEFVKQSGQECFLLRTSLF